uniref:Cytochrome c biogenesis protein CcsA n=1 Tax=Caloglossa intermedia TaxID=100879 RepID=A0A1Z1M5Q1_9FLOR|nr:cytochrome c biogenesis protein ccs1 [Caloglossa intermedia]ARW61407.1 cytochrome c biogenesis protein ccs1 [Caloglossa intermedia]
MTYNIDKIENMLNNASFILLLMVFILQWLSLIITKANKFQRISQVLIIITNLCLSSILTLRWITNLYFPLSNLYESLIFLTWCITFFSVILEKQNKSKLTSGITTPICLLIIAFTSISLPQNMKTASSLVPALQSNWLIMHVTIIILSYAALMIGSLLSFLFLIIGGGRDIKIQGNSNNYNKKTFIKSEADTLNSFNSSIYTFNRINLLESLDNLSYRIIGLGFPLLTVGIIAGAVWANEAWGSYWSWDPKETWALITWLIFAIYLHSRLNQSWQGKKPAILASFGFVIVWICYLGVNFLGKGLHSYGWIS